MTQSKAPLGIFWDIENCVIPANKLASSIVKHIRDFIERKHPECGFPLQFSCACDASKLDKRVSEGLNRSGVDVVHVNSTSKNAADDKLQELIDNFIDSNCGSDSVLVVITGDINFNKAILKARKKNIVVVLMHGINCSQDLRNSANECYLYDDIIKDIEKEDDCVQIMPAHLKVHDLPKDISDDKVRNRLSKLFDNCGGKVVDVRDGSALIRFAGKDDAQRALQRMNGEDCFGSKIKLTLISIDSKPVEKKPEEKITVLMPAKNDCKSVIQGIETKKDQNLLKLVRKLVSDWKDSQINPNLIDSVERNTKKAQEDGKVTLFVTAVSAEANQKLINGAKQHIDPSYSVKWTEFRELKPQTTNDSNSKTKPLNKATPLSNISKPTEALSQSQPISTRNSVPDDCKSVIIGLETKKDENVTKVVRKLVSDWNDSQINPNFIVSVNRNTKPSKDGRVTLFVTATNAESNNKLINGAKKYKKPNEKIKWRAYISKPQRSDSTASDESMASNNSQALTQKNNKPKKNKLTEIQLKEELSNIRMNMKLFAGFLFDNNSDAALLTQLYVNLKSMQSKYIAKYINTFENNLINLDIRDIGSNLENLFTIYEKKYGNNSSPVKDQSKNAKKKSNVSVIIGLSTQQNNNVLLLVRGIISRWNDSRISAEDVTAVSRDTKWSSRDGKAMLFVTAKNWEKNKLILKLAKTKFNNAEEKLLWNKYSGKSTAK